MQPKHKGNNELTKQDATGCKAKYSENLQPTARVIIGLIVVNYIRLTCHSAHAQDVHRRQQIATIHT
jgi:hypothetical protein